MTTRLVALTTQLGKSGELSVAGAERVEGRVGDGDEEVGLEKKKERNPCLESQLPPNKAVCVWGASSCARGWRV